MPLPLRFWATVNSWFRSDTALPADCPLRSTLLGRGRDLAPAIRDHLAHLLDRGQVRMSCGGHAWHFLQTGSIPGDFGELVEIPVLLASTADGNTFLLELDLHGRCTIHSRTAIRKIADLHVREMIVPGTGLGPEELFYWGVCPHDPEFARAHHQAICERLRSLHADHDLEGIGSFRECFSGPRGKITGLRVTRPEEEWKISVAMPQFFTIPTGEAQVLIADPLHSCLDAVTTIDGLAEHLQTPGESE